MFALSEAYPDLKANQNFLELQEELTATEDRIAYARQFYNDSVIATTPRSRASRRNLVAGMGASSEREFFEADRRAGPGLGPVLTAVPSHRSNPPCLYEQIARNKRQAFFDFACFVLLVAASSRSRWLLLRRRGGIVSRS